MKRLAVVLLPLVAAAAVLAVVLSASGGPSHPASDSPSTRPVAKGDARQRDTKSRSAPAPDKGELRGAASRRLAVPILMYHVIGNPKPGTPNLGLWVTPSLFASQMATLKRAGYQAVTLGQAWRGWTEGGPMPRKPIVLTFDDGYPGDYTHAMPVLRRLGWPGVLNLAWHDLGADNLSSRQVRGLIAAGWEIDSHTINHPDMTAIPAARVDYELRESKRLIKEKFGVDAQFFCYPAGRYNASVEAAVKAAGYLGATTELEGYAKRSGDPYALPRMRVQYGESGASLLARLRAARPAS